MIQEAYCPACNVALGSPLGEVGVFCWKCGLAFGETASTKPILRGKPGYRRYTPGRVLGALFGPGLTCGSVILIYPRLPLRAPSLGGFALIPVLGLTLFQLACLGYVLECLLLVNRGWARLTGGVLFAVLAAFDILLLLVAAGVLAQ